MSRGADIVALEARELAGAIRARQVSCVEVMRAYLAQIARLNGAANAIVALRDADDLLREAAERDAALARGDVVGPLHGLPHAVKDLSPVKGLAFTRGSPIYQDFVAPEDGLTAERLRAAGAIIIGKTNVPEFGLGSHTVNPVYGATRNTYDPARTCGGSSGGAAVALALRMLPLADGSDTGGSLRNPAGWNNVYGFRPSWGRVPLDAPEAWLPGLGVPGPMARNVSDLELLFSVMAGPDPRAPLSLETPGAAFRDPPKLDPKGVRIGWLGDLGGQVPYEPEVLEVCGAALKRFEALSCVVEEARPTEPAEPAWDAFMTLRAWRIGAEFTPIAADPGKGPLLNAQVMFEVERAGTITGADVVAASTVRTSWARSVRQLFERFDYLVMPTAQMFPFPIETRWPTEVAGVAMRTYHEWMQGVSLVTMAGCPSLAAPAGFSAAGLPIGLQIIAPVQAEMACLQLAAAYEEALPLWRMRPPPAPIS